MWPPGPPIWGALGGFIHGFETASSVFNVQAVPSLNFRAHRPPQGAKMMNTHVASRVGAEVAVRSSQIAS